MSTSRRKLAAPLAGLLALTIAGSIVGTAGAVDSARKSGGRALAHRSGKVVSAQGAPTALTTFVGKPAGEPTLGLTSEENIFYTAIQSNTRVDIQRSSDGGKTWETKSPTIGGRNAQLLTLDPYVYVDPWTDRVFTIDLTVACSYMSFTDDEGESWTTNPLACGRPVNDHQTLFAGPPVSTPMLTYASIVYYCWNDVASSSCSKSIDGGLSFRPTGSPAFAGVSQGSEGGDGDGFCGGLHGHGVVGEDGTVFLPREYCGFPYVAISKDEGTTWTTVRVSGKRALGGNDPSVAVDDKGNVYYLWNGPDRLPWLSVSRDGGNSWSRPVMVGPPGLRESNLTTIDAGAPGKVAIAYMGSMNSPFRPKCEEECDNDYTNTTWNGYLTMSDNVFSSNPTFYSATVNHPRDPLKRRNCGPGRCDTTIYDFIDVVVGPDGLPYGAYVDACLSVCIEGGSDAGNEGLVGKLVGGPSLL